MPEKYMTAACSLVKVENLLPQMGEKISFKKKLRRAI